MIAGFVFNTNKGGNFKWRLIFGASNDKGLICSVLVRSGYFATTHIIYLYIDEKIAMHIDDIAQTIYSISISIDD